MHSQVGDHDNDDDNDAAVRSVPSKAARPGRAVPEEGSRSWPHQDQSSLELGGTRWTCLCWSPSSLLSILPCATQGRSVRLYGRRRATTFPSFVLSSALSVHVRPSSPVLCVMSSFCSTECLQAAYNHLHLLAAASGLMFLKTNKSGLTEN